MPDSRIKVLFTAALIDQSFESRKNEYIKSLKLLQSYGVEPYVIEARVNKTSFLDEYSTEVFYAQTNDDTLINKGVNEARLILAAFDKYNFKDDDIIIKITGRYLLESDRFLNIIRNDIESDAFVKIYYLPKAFFCGCYAMRFKYFKEMLSGLDLQKMERNLISIENELYDFIMHKQNKLKVNIIDTIDMTANIFKKGGPFLTKW